MTVFLSFVLLILAAVVFSLLESARVSGLKSCSQMDAMLTADNLFAEYQKELWTEYGLLFLDGSYGSKEWNCDGIQNRALEFSLKNLGSSDTSGSLLTGAVDFYRLVPMQAELEDYELATDYDGAVFRAQAAQAKAASYTDEAIENLYKVLTGAEDADEAGEALEQAGTQAIKELEEAAQEANGSSSSEDSGETTEGGDSAVQGKVPEENPMELLKKLKNQGILTLVAPQMDISGKEIDTSAALLNREVAAGTYSEPQSGVLSEVAEEMLFFTYLEEHFSNAADVKSGGTLDYELEYVIAGKSSDINNLKAVVNRLLLIREGANALYLETDAEKQALLYEVALGISVATGTEAFIALIKQGLLLAWAYVESIADVRILLQGGKIPLTKTSQDWATDLMNLSKSLAEAGEKQHDSGLGYVRYLQMIMFLMKDKTVNYRSMDMLEARTGTAMDCMAQRLKIKMSYQAEPLFWSMATIADQSLSAYGFTSECERNYMDR